MTILRDCLPLLVDYDQALDIVTINGKKYSGDLFRTFEWGTKPGELLAIKSDDSEVVTVHTIQDVKKFADIVSRHDLSPPGENDTADKIALDILKFFEELEK